MVALLSARVGAGYQPVGAWGKDLVKTRPALPALQNLGAQGTLEWVKGPAGTFLGDLALCQLSPAGPQRPGCRFPRR